MKQHHKGDEEKERERQNGIRTEVGLAPDRRKKGEKSREKTMPLLEPPDRDATWREVAEPWGKKHGQRPLYRIQEESQGN